MREIKFRGWDVTGQKGWVFGDLVHNKKVCKEEPFLRDRVMVGGYEVVPESVGQFIGREDDIGRDLYEGDICSIFISGKKMMAYIFYNDYTCEFMYVAKHTSCPIYWIGNSRKRGTLFENRDILD